MKNQFNDPHLNKTVTNLDLQELVKKLVTGILPVAVNRGNLIVNDIPAKLVVSTCENLLFLVLNTLLTKTVTINQSKCIHIDAALTGDWALIKVKDRNGDFFNTITRDLEQEQLIAEKIGGCISISQYTNGDTITTLSFYNHANVA